MTIEHFDVLIIGAGLSGIGAAHHLQTKCADRSYAILEGRDRIGGTCSKPSDRAAHRSSPIKLICDYVCRLLNYMKRHGVAHCTPRNTDPSITTQTWVDFSSGYFQRSMHLFPKQGSRVPWKLHQNYPRDIMLLRLGRIDDGVLEFARPA